MSSSPSDKVRRQNHDTSHHKPDLVEVIREAEQMQPGLPEPELRPSDKVLIAKWKIRSAYYYLAFTSVLCLVTILLNPGEQVRLVVLAVWASAAAVGGAVLRWSYDKI